MMREKVFYVEKRKGERAFCYAAFCVVLQCFVSVVGEEKKHKKKKHCSKSISVPLHKHVHIRRRIIETKITQTPLMKHQSM